jgi:Fur family ferric uptake transcriptional regulator
VAPDIERAGPGLVEAGLGATAAATAPGAAVGEHHSIEDVLAMVRAHGGRVTSARRLLLSVLFARREHRSAEDLAAEVQAEAPDVHLSTIYRNLDELERLGVIDRTPLGRGPAAYHLASASHGHFVCAQCGSMTEVPDEIFRGLAGVAANQYGFTIDPHRFAVIGRCAACLPL